MKQIVQHMKTGDISTVEVPMPDVKKGFVLVRVHASVISAGTERSSVSERKQSLLQRAKNNPDLVGKVWQDIRSKGLSSTYQRVKGRLDSVVSMGYSAAGVVLEVGKGVTDLSPGDRVACAGAGYAHHAEIILVPNNLCVKVPPDVDLRSAAYTTIGAIALQGIRQAQPGLGETVVVIGLGLVGQLTVQMLKASGCIVCGVDPDPAAVRLAKKCGADAAFPRSEDVKKLIARTTRGVGADVVIITAATPSEDPVRLAGEVSRDKGRVVLVGDVGLKLPRGPYYMKELDFRLSRSYGPGRYDPAYEEEGRDYPVGYVRWTERRNMEEVIRLMSSKLLLPERVTTHVFPVEKAGEGFAAIAGKKKAGGPRAFGVVLTYSSEEKAKPRARKTASVQRSDGKPEVVGFVGAGSFAQAMLLPPLKGVEGVVLKSVCSGTGVSALNTSRLFGFKNATTALSDVLDDAEIGTVFIASRHHLHAAQVQASLKAGKHVFVEKPLVMLPSELDDVLEAYHDSRGGQRLLMVGFNRRFAPSVLALKEFFGNVSAPFTVHYRVHAGQLPKDHWSLNPEEGGGRIVGEVCHFVDTIQFLTGSLVARVYAERVGTPGAGGNDDSVSITLKCEDGSIGTIHYLANGDGAVPKEFIEMFGGGRTGVLDNFRRLTLYRSSRKSERTWSKLDKGHDHEVRSFMTAVREGTECPIRMTDIAAVSRTTFLIEESLRRGIPVRL